MKRYLKIDDLTQIVINAAYKVHNTLGAGFLEKIYEKALFLELKKIDIEVECQYPIAVFYDGEEIGKYYADLYADGQLIIELKSVENLTVAHEKQVVNYLAATGIDNGLLINFGSSVQIKRKYRVYKKPVISQD
ncbi:MAG: GxxExxY protein [Prevotellaceae bacterium]|jgi:GxxExxY protein|nr:GxxExxY protein [Prevotellaceae bacterium]